MSGIFSNKEQLPWFSSCVDTASTFGGTGVFSRRNAIIPVISRIDSFQNVRFRSSRSNVAFETTVLINNGCKIPQKKRRQKLFVLGLTFSECIATTIGATINKKAKIVDTPKDTQYTLLSRNFRMNETRICGSSAPFIENRAGACLTNNGF